METEQFRNPPGGYRDDEEEEEEEEEEGTSSSSTFLGCNCFGSSFSKWRNNDSSNSYLLTRQKTESSSLSSSWVMEKLKKVKEISEMVAGPKWKNFIRRKKQRKNYNKGFYYNAESYALNFDCGEEDDNEYDDVRGFSSRFAAVPPPPPHV